MTAKQSHVVICKSSLQNEPLQSTVHFLCLLFIFSGWIKISLVTALHRLLKTSLQKGSSITSSLMFSSIFVFIKTGINLERIQTVIADFQRVLTVLQAGFLSLNYSCVNTSFYRLVVQSFETELQLQASFLFALEGLHKSSRQDFLCRMQGKHQHALFSSGGRLQRRIKRRERERKHRERISDRERARQWNEGDEAILWRLGFVVCVVVISSVALLCNCPSWLKLERDGDWFSLFDSLGMSRLKSYRLLTAQMILLDRMYLTMMFCHF